jgi:hypothetical protein
VRWLGQPTIGYDNAQYVDRLLTISRERLRQEPPTTRRLMHDHGGKGGETVRPSRSDGYDKVIVSVTALIGRYTAMTT